VSQHQKGKTRKVLPGFTFLVLAHLEGKTNLDLLEQEILSGSGIS